MKYSVQLRIDSALVIWISVILSSLFIFSLKSNAQQEIILGQAFSPLVLSDTIILFDSGGPNNNYGPGETHVITFNSDPDFDFSPGAPIRDIRVFLDFCYVPEIGYNYNLDANDTIRVYDGPDTSAPLLEEFTGTSDCGFGLTFCVGRLISTTHELTIEFVSSNTSIGGNFEFRLYPVNVANSLSTILCNIFTIEGTEQPYLDNRKTINSCEPLIDNASCVGGISLMNPITFESQCNDAFIFDPACAVIYEYFPDQSGDVQLEVFGEGLGVAVISCNQIFGLCGGFSPVCIEYSGATSYHCINFSAITSSLISYYIIVQTFPPLSGQEDYDWVISLKDLSCDKPSYCNCTLNYDPQCTFDGKVFSNSCFAQCAGYLPGQYFPKPPGQSCENVNVCQNDPPLLLGGGQFDFGEYFSDNSLYFTVLNENDPTFFDAVEVSVVDDLLYTCPQPGRYRFCFYYCLDNILSRSVVTNLRGESSNSTSCCDNVVMCCVEVCYDQEPEPLECSNEFSNVFFSIDCDSKSHLYDNCIGGSLIGSAIKVHSINHDGGFLRLRARAFSGNNFVFKIYDEFNYFNGGDPIECDFVLNCTGSCDLIIERELDAGTYYIVTIGDNIGQQFQVRRECFCGDFTSGIDCPTLVHHFIQELGNELVFYFEAPDFIGDINNWQVNDVDALVTGNGVFLNFPGSGTFEICFEYFDFIDFCFKNCCRTFCIFNPLDCGFVEWIPLSGSSIQLEVTDPDFDGEVEWLLDNHPDGPLVIGSGNFFEIDLLTEYGSIIDGDFEISARYGTPGCWRYCCIIIPRPSDDCTDVIYDVMIDGLGVQFERADGLEGTWGVISEPGDTLIIANGVSNASFYSPIGGTRRICWWRVNPSTGQTEYCCRDFCTFNPFNCNFTGFTTISTTSDEFEFASGVAGQYWEVENQESGELVTINEPSTIYEYPEPGVYKVCGYFINTCGALQWCCFTRCISSNDCTLDYALMSTADDGYTVELNWGVSPLDSLIITGIDDPDFLWNSGGPISGSTDGFELILPPTPGRYTVCLFYPGVEVGEFCCKTIYVYPCSPWKFRPIPGEELMFTFENQDEYPVERWELEDEQGNLINTFFGNNTIIEFPSFGTYFVAPIIIYPDLCEGYRACRRPICVQPIFNCPVISPSPAPLAITNGGFTYGFSLDLNQVPDAENIQWYVDEIPDMTAEGSNAMFSFGPEFFGREVTVSVIYFDGFCWRTCCIVICIVDPFACEEILFTPTPFADNLQLNFELPDNYTEIFWDLHTEAGESFATGTGSVFEVDWSNFDVEDLVISVSYFDPISACRRICCRRLCLPDPLTCGFIKVRPAVEPLPNGNFVYEAVLEDTGTDIEWYWHDADGNIINNAQGAGVNASIELTGNFEGEIFITYRYFAGDCWKVCCQRVCVQNPYSCGAIFWTLSPAGLQGINYTFRTELEGIETFEWEIVDAMTGQVVSVSNELNPTVTLQFGNMYHIIYRYFDPIGNCWVLCCRKLCVEDPFACGDIVVRSRAVLGGPVYVAELTNMAAEDIYWQVDEDLSNNQTGGFSFEVDFSQYSSGTYNITVFYRVGECWFACCRSFCIENPLVCTLLSATSEPDAPDIVLNKPDDLTIENYFVFTPDGDSLDILDASTNIYIPPVDGNLWFCSYFFLNNCWQYCCFEYSDCDSEINCDGIVLTSDGTEGMVLIDAVLLGGTAIDSIRISGPTGSNFSILGSVSSFVCPVPGNYNFCFYYVNECGFVDFCCVEYCADNFEYPCLIAEPELQSDNLYLISYTGDEDAISWEVNGDIVAQDAQSFTFEVDETGVYEICVIRRTLCGKVLEKCCRSFCLGDSPCEFPDYVVNNNTLAVFFSNIDSDTLYVFNESGVEVAKELVSDFDEYTYTVPTAGIYSFCFGYVDGCGRYALCCIDEVCVGVPPMCGSFEFNISNLDLMVSLDLGLDGQVEWDFGDGNTSLGLTASHTYSEPGLYEVCYTRITPCGTCSYCEEVLVVPTGELVVRLGKKEGISGSLVKVPLLIESNLSEALAGEFYVNVSDRTIANPIRVIDGKLSVQNAPLLSENPFVLALQRLSAPDLVQGDTLCWIEFELLGEAGDTVLVNFERTEDNFLFDLQAETYFPILIDGCVIITEEGRNIEGMVTLWESALRGIRDVRVSLLSDQNLVFETNSDIEGNFDMNNVAFGSVPYEVSLFKEPKESIVQLAPAVQAANIVRQINDRDHFTSLRQFIGGDYDCNGIIDVRDVARLMLESRGEILPNNSCGNQRWFFIRQKDDPGFVSHNDWLEKYEAISNPMLGSDYELGDMDFYGIRKGDVINIVNPSRSSQELFFYTVDTILEPGVHEIPVLSFNFDNISSFGFALRYNEQKGALLGLVQDRLFGSNLFVDIESLCNNCMSISWVDLGGKGLDNVNGEQIFTLRLEITERILLSDLISFDEEIYPPLGTDGNLDLVRVWFTLEEADIILSDGSLDVIGYELYQNRPNPFTGETIIGYSTPKGGKVELVIFDQFGKVVMTRQDYPSQAGYHEIQIQINNTSGVLYYQLRSEDFTATKKMISIGN